MYDWLSDDDLLQKSINRKVQQTILDHLNEEFDPTYYYQFDLSHRLSRNNNNDIVQPPIPVPNSTYLNRYSVSSGNRILLFYGLPIEQNLWLNSLKSWRLARGYPVRLTKFGDKNFNDGIHSFIHSLQTFI